MLGLPRSSQKPLVFVRICLAAVPWHSGKCVCGVCVRARVRACVRARGRAEYSGGRAQGKGALSK